jgi:4,5-dihydroxyphthalate decarboxylase
VRRIAYAGVSHFARTLALESGAVAPAGFDLTFLALPVPDAFGRMVAHVEFDAAELSLASYMGLVASGDTRFVGLPIFPARYFRHRQLYVHAGSSIERPADLIGRRVGIPDYHQTAALWIRGFLQHDYGVGPESMRWIRGGLDRPGGHERLGLPPPTGVRLSEAPAGRSLGELLAAGEIDALVAPRAPAAYAPGGPIRRLFADYAAVERDYHRRTGIFPIMHLVVLSREAYSSAPELAVALLEAFVEAKRIGNELLRDGRFEAVADPWWQLRLEELEQRFGGDPFPYGIEANRPVIEAAIRYAHEQGLLARRIELEELFAPETHAHPGG